jgi:ribosome-binding protein aMBF1 (putative translation factor)
LGNIVRGVIGIVPAALGSMPAPSPRYARNPVLTALGKAVRSARLERGISQEELAHLASIDRSYMSSIERGEQNVAIINISRIASALGIAVAELFLDARL